MTAQVFEFDPQSYIGADCPGCGRDSCAGDCEPAASETPGASGSNRRDAGGPRPMVESAAEFMARVSSMPPAKPLLGELLQADASAVWHGQPRTLKTMALLETFIAATLGEPPFGLERFRPERPLVVWYIGEEDAERPTLNRLRLLLAGRGLAEPPGGFSLSIRAGINLDDERDQEALLEHGKRLRPDIIAGDPLRALTGCVDQGPRELKPFAGFMRRLMQGTGAAFVGGHHDTKPPVGKPDDRARPQRASGGGLFSIADCPVSFERIDATRSLVVPSSFKFRDDPRPFTLRLESGEGWLRLVGEDVTAGAASSVALHERILEHLRFAPGCTGNAVARVVTGGKAAILTALRDLEAAGKVDSVEQKRGTGWFVRGEA